MMPDYDLQRPRFGPGMGLGLQPLGQNMGQGMGMGMGQHFGQMQHPWMQYMQGQYPMHPNGNTGIVPPQFQQPHQMGPMQFPGGMPSFGAQMPQPQMPEGPMDFGRRRQPMFTPR